jgi:predicted transcriptional regulator/DNA-binding XRE family transcriptional regulator
VQIFTEEKANSLPDRRDRASVDQEPALDLGLFGQRLRHLRRARGLTLAELGRRVGRAPSALSLLENGRREPKLSQIDALARALSVPAEELTRRQPPSRRAQLEISLAEAQRDPVYAALQLPRLRPGPRVPSDVLEHLLALFAELRKERAKPAATTEEAREANAGLRAMMRDRGNYFAEIEKAAERALAPAAYSGGALSQGMIQAVVAHHGFTVRYVQDLPRASRSVTDLRNRRIYLRKESLGPHSPRAVLLQTLGHFVLGHRPPADFADFLRQRVEANYFAAAVLVPEQAAVAFLRRAMQARELSVEDLRDIFAVSYEMAAHRFTNLATHHLGLDCHFVKNDEGGIIYKAYENDGVIFPADATGAIEGQRMCRYWSGRQVFAAADPHSPHYQYSDTPAGTYWCAASVDPGSEYAVTLGVRYADARWFRGRETTVRAKTACPDPACCQRPPAELAVRWDKMARPSARTHSHLLAALPAGSFPGVDEVELYEFLERHERS